MANQIDPFKTELFNLFGATTNLDASTKQKLRDRFVTAYPTQWTAFLAAGNTDTAANRGKFAVEITFQFWKDIYTSESYKANVAAIPAADILQ
jgi:hypothetical protein